MKNKFIKSSGSNVDSTGSNVRHSFNNVLFENHVRVELIRESNTDDGEFRFQPISTEELKKVIIGLDCNKSNLNGSIGGNAIIQEIDPLNKENYRPASVLSHVSKIFEKIVYEQINSYMALWFSHLLCRFRKKS